MSRIWWFVRLDENRFKHIFTYYTVRSCTFTYLLYDETVVVIQGNIIIIGIPTYYELLWISSMNLYNFQVFMYLEIQNVAFKYHVDL